MTYLRNQSNSLLKRLRKAYVSLTRRSQPVLPLIGQRVESAIVYTRSIADAKKSSPSAVKQGWKTVLIGSRFTHSSESRYAPIEGEALAVADAL